MTGVKKLLGRQKREKKRGCVCDKENSVESIEIQEVYNHVATIFVPSECLFCVVDSYTASHNILYGS